MAGLKPITRKEALLDNIAGGENQITPVTREEQFLAALAGEGEAPDPITRAEYFMQKAAEAGGGGGGGGDLLLNDTHITLETSGSQAELTVTGTVVAWFHYSATVDASKAVASACFGLDDTAYTVGSGMVWGEQVGNKFTLHVNGSTFPAGRLNFVYQYRED